MNESTTKPPPRRRLQIHLSTAIVLMFVSGLLMWANFCEQTQVLAGGRTSRQTATYGLPCTAVQVDEVYCLLDGKPSRLYSSRSKPNYAMGAINLAVGLVVLLVVWWFCEHLIYRKEQRKILIPESTPTPRPTRD